MPEISPPRERSREPVADHDNGARSYRSSIRGDGARAPRVAVVDDDPEMQLLLRELFELEGYEVATFPNGMRGLEALKTPGSAFDLVICDLKLPDTDGLEFIETARIEGIDAPVILITAHAAIETAAEALRKGAFDYIAKPINPVEMIVISTRAVKLRRLERDYERLRGQIESAWRKGSLIGRSHRMQAVFSLIDRVAPSTATVLVTGESGVGKEMIARAIHDASPRRHKPFIAINCSAIPDNLLESELFGHKRGAFTGAADNRRGLFEEANLGTLFLDEIGDMPLALQAKLLRVIQERKVRPVGDNVARDIDVRLIAATHKDLKAAIRAGTFREDLFFRLNVVPIALPALRERTEDIPVLAEHFLAKYCERSGVPVKSLTRAAMAKLLRLGWAGNVRELENTIERAVVLSTGELIDEPEIRAEGSSDHELAVRELFAKLPTLSQLEREYIAYVLAETGDHKERASEILGINRKTLYRKQLEYGINATEPGETP